VIPFRRAYLTAAGRNAGMTEIGRVRLVDKPVAAPAPRRRPPRRSGT